MVLPVYESFMLSGMLISGSRQSSSNYNDSALYYCSFYGIGSNRAETLLNGLIRRLLISLLASTGSNRLVSMPVSNPPYKIAERPPDKRLALQGPEYTAYTSI